MRNKQEKTAENPSSSIESDAADRRVPPVKALLFLVTFMALASYTTLVAWIG